MRYFVWTLALAAPAFCGQAYTSAASGNWTDPAVWTCTPGPCSTPGDGDTAIIQNGHKITVTGNVTVGASGVTNSAAAIALNCSGQVEVSGAATLRLRGDVTHSGGTGCRSDAVTLGAGATWIFDASMAAAPGSTRYRFGGTADFQFRHVVCNGSVGARVTVTSDLSNGALPGAFWVNPVGGSGWYYGGGLRATFTDFIHIGDAGTAGFQAGVGDVLQWSVQDSTFTNCGSIASIVTVSGAGVFIHARNHHRETADASAVLVVNFGTALTTGTRQITSNVFDRSVFGAAGSGQAYVIGVTIEDNYFGDSLAPQFSTTAPWASFKRNFVRIAAQRGGSFQAWLAGSAEDNYFYADGYSDNVRYAGVHAALANVVRGNIFGQFDNPVTDSGEALTFYANPAGTVTQAVQQNIILPTKTGHSCAALAGMSSGHENVVVAVEHTTWAGGTANLSRPFGMLQPDDTGGVSQQFSVRSNVVWNTQPFAQPFFKMYPGQLAVLTENVCAPAACDYNAGWNHGDAAAACANCANQGNGYVEKFTATPGQHDLHAEPRWADYKRNVELFDTKYLGNAAAAWTGGAHYNAGEFASVSSAGVYWGLPVNYRCTAAHDAAEANKPGTGENWRTYWEPAALYRLRTETLAERRFRDGAIGAGGDSITGTLVKWVRQGYRPTNPAYYAAGHDGQAPGAMPMPKPRLLTAVVY